MGGDAKLPGVPDFGDLTDLTSATLALANLLANCMDCPAVIQAFISAWGNLHHFWYKDQEGNTLSPTSWNYLCQVLFAILYACWVYL